MVITKLGDQPLDFLVRGVKVLAPDQCLDVQRVDNEHYIRIELLGADLQQLREQRLSRVEIVVVQVAPQLDKPAVEVPVLVRFGGAEQVLVDAVLELGEGFVILALAGEGAGQPADHLELVVKACAWGVDAQKDLTGHGGEVGDAESVPERGSDG